MIETKPRKTMTTFMNVLDMTAAEFEYLFSRKGFKLASGSLDKRVAFFMREFNLTREQVKVMFLKFNALLDIDVESDQPTSAKNKIKILENLGFTRAEIIKHPIVLTIPSSKIEIRFALCLEQGKDKEFFMQNNNFMYSEDKVFARYCFLVDNKFPILREHYASINLNI